MSEKSIYGDPGYYLKMLLDLSGDISIYTVTGQCPACKRLDGRNKERYSTKVKLLFEGQRLHCVVCGREDDAISLLPADQVVTAKYD